jgi:hypothetical protein
MRQFTTRVAVVNDFSLEFNGRASSISKQLLMVRRPLALNGAAPAALQIVQKKRMKYYALAHHPKIEAR